MPSPTFAHSSRSKAAIHWTGRFPGATEPAHQRTDSSRFQSRIRVRKDRSAAKLRLVPGSGPRDLASRSRGAARTGSFDVTIGDAVFVQSDRVNIHAGTIGMVALVAYTGGGQAPPPAAAPQTVGAQWMHDGHRRCRCQFHSLEAKTVPTNGRLETTK